MLTGPFEGASFSGICVDLYVAITYHLISFKR